MTQEDLDYATTATLTIHDAQTLSRDTRKKVAQWMRSQANMLLKSGDNLSKRYRARYLTRRDG